MKQIIILLVLILFSNCARTQNFNKAMLEGQIWTFERKINKGGFGSGNSWTFFANNRFTEREWYSGGAYWIHNYSGTYFYNADKKVVFLMYDKDKAPYFKNGLKKQLNLKITEIDTTLSITNGWIEQKKVPSNIKQHMKMKDSKILEGYTFKIERIGK